MTTEALAVPTPQPASPLVLPAVDAVAMKAAMRAYTELCEAVLEPTDYQTVQGKTFKKRSAWQKLATAFSVTTEIVDKVVHVDDDGRVLRAEFVVRATAPNGRHEDGYGACSRSEGRGFSKPDHDIPATAETRARNRACANLFAFGELTAEEMGGDGDERGARGPVLERSDRSHRNVGGAGSARALAPAVAQPRGRNLVPIRRAQGAQDSDQGNPDFSSVSPHDDVAPAETPASPASDVVAAARKKAAEDARVAAKADMIEECVALAMKLEHARREEKQQPTDYESVRYAAEERCTKYLGATSESKVWSVTFDSAMPSHLEALRRKMQFLVNKLGEGAA